MEKVLSPVSPPTPPVAPTSYTGTPAVFAIVTCVAAIAFLILHRLQSQGGGATVAPPLEPSPDQVEGEEAFVRRILIDKKSNVKPELQKVAENFLGKANLAQADIVEACRFIKDRVAVTICLNQKDLVRCQQIVADDDRRLVYQQEEALAIAKVRDFERQEAIKEKAQTQEEIRKNYINILCNLMEEINSQLKTLREVAEELKKAKRAVDTYMRMKKRDVVDIRTFNRLQNERGPAVSFMEQQHDPFENEYEARYEEFVEACKDRGPVALLKLKSAYRQYAELITSIGNLFQYKAQWEHIRNQFESQGV